jgi:hypothetical protein
MVNIGKHYTTAFVESDGISILKRKLETNRIIKCFFSDNDKTPNTDGFFELTKKDGTPIKRVNVQVKTTSELKNNKLSVDTKIMNFIFEKITTDPTFLFIVDLKTEEIYYRHIDIDYLLSIEFDKKNDIVIDFSKDNVFDIELFEKELNIIADKHNRLIVKKSVIEIAELQEAINYLNNTLFSIPLLVETLMPKLHRVGIATSREEKKLIFKRSDEGESELKSSNNYGAYFILKGEKRYEIEDLQDKEEYSNVFYDGIGDMTPMKYAKHVLSRILKHFFNRSPNYIRFMPDFILSEISFAFLDKMGSKYKTLSSEIYSKTFYKDNVDVVELEFLFKKTMKYMMYILNSDKNLYQQEADLKRILINRINSFTSYNGIDFLELATTYCPPQIFENTNYINDISDESIKNGLSLLTSEYTIYYFAIKELIKRNIKTIFRPWNFEPVKEMRIFLIHGQYFFDKRFYNQCKKWFEETPRFYRETAENIKNIDLDINIKVTISIEGNEYRPNIDFSTNYYTQPNEKFIIEVVERIDDDAIHKYGNIASASSTTYNIVSSKMPLYYTVAGLLYKKISQNYSLVYHGILIKNKIEAFR